MSSGHTHLISSGENSSAVDFSMGQRLSGSSESYGSQQRQMFDHHLTVYLHGNKSVECTDLNQTVEELCVSILQTHLPTVGPAALNLFTLAVIDNKKNSKCVWKSPHTDLKDVAHNLTENPTSKLYLRIRFLPAKDRVDNLKALGDDVIKYLYKQCKEDFVSERLKSVFGAKKSLTSAKSRGLAVLDLLITARLQQKTIELFLETIDLKDYLPRPELLDFWKKMKLKKNMKSHLIRFDKSHPVTTTGEQELMLGYIKDILKEVMEYSVEQYTATTLDSSVSATVQIVVDIHHHPSGIKINEEFFSRIEDLDFANVTPSYQSQTSSWRVHLDRSNGRPAVMRFNSKEVAESFVSCLDGYHRLLKDYYFNICQNMVPPSLKTLKMLKSHGPIDPSYAVEKIKKKLDDQDSYYLYKQDLFEYNMFTVIYCKNGQARTEIMLKNANGNFCLKSNPGHESDDPGKLIKQQGDRDVLPTNLMRLRPNNGETCSVLRNLFLGEEEEAHDESAEDSAETKRRQPILYLESDLKLKDIIDNGTFTQVHKAELTNEKVVAVKVLRIEDVPQEQIYKCIQPFQNSVMHHMLFDDLAFFVRIHGICLTSAPRQSPSMVIMDYAPHGSLLKFFRTRKPDQPIYLQHLVYAADQVAQGLYYLEEHNLFHGNICCQNILVFRYEMNDISVKLADPGMTLVYDNQPLTHRVNQRSWKSLKLYRHHNFEITVRVLANPRVPPVLAPCRELSISDTDGYASRYSMLLIGSPQPDRLPWIAPELLSPVVDKKKESTLHSDIYALGATVLEMFSQGANPMDSDRLKSKTPKQAVEFFKQNSWLSLPRPEDLKVRTAVRKVDGIDSEVPVGKLDECKQKINELISKCLNPEPKDRPRAKEIVRDLHTLGSEYGTDYHNYESMYNDESAVPLWSSQETTVPDDTSRDTVPDITGSFQADEERKLTVGIPQAILHESTAKRTSARTSKQELRPRFMDSRPGVPIAGRSLTKQRQPLPNTPTNSSIEDIQYLIDSNKLDFSSGINLGQGHYGAVKKGTFRYQPSKVIEIAAKCLKGEFRSVLDNEEFRQEATIMAQLKHENIVRFYGISNEKIIMEFVNNGSMSVHLRDRRKKNDLLCVYCIMKIIRDIASGMQHLASQRIIHSDLAGRNVLLTDELVAKISDFGLARNLGEKNYYKRSKEKELPAMWCAPEGLSYQRFTTKGDVWSFGVVVWEAFSHGKRPYSDDQGDRDHERFNFKRDGFFRLQQGYRMKMPPNCPPVINHMTMKCWEYDPEKRPDFNELMQTCSNYLTEESPKLNIAGPSLIPNNIIPHLTHFVAANVTIPLPAKPFTPLMAKSAYAEQQERKENQKANFVPEDVKIEAVEEIEGASLQMHSNHDETPSSIHCSQSQVAEENVYGQDSTPVGPELQKQGQGRASMLNFQDQFTKQKSQFETESKVPNGQCNMIRQHSDIVSSSRLCDQVHPTRQLSEGHVTSCNSSVQGQAIRQLSEKTAKETGQDSNERQRPKLPEIPIAQLINSEVKRTDVMLGTGHFGVVYKGKFKGQDVALKTLNKQFWDQMMTEEFCHEVEILSHLSHPQIVTFHGFCTKEYMLVMEFIAFGSLKEHLTKSNLTQRQMVGIMTDVANGMEYLSRNNVLHCDLAARNILLTPQFQAKITDFGLSKVLDKNMDYYRRSSRKEINAWWAAPEVLELRKLSTQSDIWSYGVVMWETFSHGGHPKCIVIEADTDHVSEVLLLNFVDLIRKGKRWPKPPDCDEQSYDIMQRCWQFEAKNRPLFKAIYNECLDLLTKHMNSEMKSSTSC